MDDFVAGFDYAGFAHRLKDAIFPEKPSAFAQRSGVPHTTLSKYLVAGGSSGPRLDIVSRVAEAAGVSIDWLVFGRGDGPGDHNVVRIPRYDAQLAAGAGSWNDGRRVIEDVPITRDMVQELGRGSTTHLAVLQARGDSMEPTIADRGFVIIDQSITTPFDDIFAFVLAGEARVKRFRRLADGLMLISDNEAYPPETLRSGEMGQLQIIGQVLGVFQAV